MNVLNPDAWQVEVIAASTGLSAGEVRDTIAKLTDTRLERAHTANMSNNPAAPKQGPTRCRNCNRTFRGTCRKCAGSIRIQTQGRTRK